MYFTSDVPTSAFKELLLKCTFNVEFKLDGKLYRQIDRVAMESPLGSNAGGYLFGETKDATLEEFY